MPQRGSFYKLAWAIHDSDPYTGFLLHEYLPAAESRTKPHVVFQKLIEQLSPDSIIAVGHDIDGEVLQLAELAAEKNAETRVLAVSTWLPGSSDVDRISGDGTRHNRFGRSLKYEEFLAKVIHAGHTSRVIPFPVARTIAAGWLTKRQILADAIYVSGSDLQPEELECLLRVYWPLLRPGGVLLRNWPETGVNSTFRKTIEHFASANRLHLSPTQSHWILRSARGNQSAEPTTQFGVAKPSASDTIRFSEAERNLRHLIELEPTNPNHLAKLGALLHQAGRNEAAIEQFQLALQHDPQNALLHNDLGCAWTALGKLADAETCLRDAIRLNPQYNNLGSVLQGQGKLEDAIGFYQQAIAIQPDHADAHSNLGCALRAQGDVASAVQHFRRAITIRPQFVDALLNLGGVLEELGQFDEALRCHRQALVISPQRPDAHCRLGSALQRSRKFDEALQAYELAVRLDPENAEARFNRSLVYLSQGKFEQGWQEYTWRVRCQRQLQPQPEWDGSSLAGSSILLHAEQGLGDTFQFIRYVEQVRKHHPLKIGIEVPRMPIPLLQQSGFEHLIPAGGPLPPHDVRASLLDLPRILGTTLETIPNQTPYLRACPERRQYWRDRLKAVPGLRIGIGWQGNPQFIDDRLRSAPLASFEPLSRVPGVRLISLQKGLGTEQLKKLSEKMKVLDFGKELDAESGAFMDTAAIVSELDLIITTDTALAHLAGALGVPVWVALSAAPEWRWLRDRDDSPWYPTMRLYRQRAWGDWGEVFSRMSEEATRLQKGLHLSSTNGATDPIKASTSDSDTQPPSSQIASGLYQQGLQSARRGDYRAAVQKFEQALTAAPDHFLLLNPTYAEAHNGLGAALQRNGQLQEAVAEFDRAIELARRAMLRLTLVAG